MPKGSGQIKSYIPKKPILLKFRLKYIVFPIASEKLRLHYISYFTILAIFQLHWNKVHIHGLLVAGQWKS